MIVWEYIVLIAEGDGGRRRWSPVYRCGDKYEALDVAAGYWREGTPTRIERRKSD